MAEIDHEELPSPEKGETVLFLHGILKSDNDFSSFENAFIQKGYQTVNVHYPSTDLTLKELGAWLDENYGEELAKAEKLDIIAHSMGGLLAREWLSYYNHPSIGKVVMLGTPNHGSEVADFVGDWALYKDVFGPAGQELKTDISRDDTDDIDYDLGLIAGSASLDPVSSSIIPGADDGKVSVPSVYMQGAKDFIVLEVSHRYLTSSEQVFHQLAFFLENGVFDHSIEERTTLEEFEEGLRKDLEKLNALKDNVQ